MDIFAKSQPKMTDNCLTIHSDVLFIIKIIIAAGKALWILNTENPYLKLLPVFTEISIINIIPNSTGFTRISIQISFPIRII